MVISRENHCIIPHISNSNSLFTQNCRAYKNITPHYQPLTFLIVETMPYYWASCPLFSFSPVEIGIC